MTLYEIALIVAANTNKERSECKDDEEPIGLMKIAAIIGVGAIVATCIMVFVR